MRILSKKGLVAVLPVMLLCLFGVAFATEDATRRLDLAKREAEAKKLAADEAKKKVETLKEEKKPRACTSTCEVKWHDTQKKNIAAAEIDAAKKTSDAAAAEKAIADTEAAIAAEAAAAKKRAEDEELAKLTPEEKAAREEAARKAIEEAATLAAAIEAAKKAEAELARLRVADSIAKAHEAARKAEEARRAAIVDSIAKAHEAARKAEEARKAAIADSIAKAHEAARKAEEAKKAAIADSIAKAQAEEARRIAELNPEMIFVKGTGLTTLGCTKEQGADCNNDERPHQNVTLNDFYISKAPITQKQWERIMGSNPSKFKNCGGNCPVESVSWIDVQEFIKKLNHMTGKKYRLLTEAEWEYAARGGGSTKNYKYSGGNNINQIAWYGPNSKQNTQAVCVKKTNELGLCDMTGNVWEWVQDWRDLYPTASSIKSNPKGPSSGTNRVYRGCSWQDNALHCRVSRRNGDAPETRHPYIGFRLALDK